MTHLKNGLRLEHFQKMKECNELDVVFKLKEMVVHVEECAEKVIRGNKMAGVDLRKYMKDISTLSGIIKDMSKVRAGMLSSPSALDYAIKKETETIESEKAIEKHLSDALAEEKIKKAKEKERLRVEAVRIAREERELKKKMELEKRSIEEERARVKADKIKAREERKRIQQENKAQIKEKWEARAREKQRLINFVKEIRNIPRGEKEKGERSIDGEHKEAQDQL